MARGVRGHMAGLAARYYMDVLDPQDGGDQSSAGSSEGGAFENTVAPTILGTGETGAVLACTLGTWSATPDSYAYQWKKDTVAISGETLPTYRVRYADKDASITCTVTATSGLDEASATTTGKSIATYGTDVVLLMNFDGEDEAWTKHSMKDSSSYGRDIFPAGFTTSPPSLEATGPTPKFGTGRYSTGSSSHVEVKTTLGEGFDFQDLPFTVEFWMYKIISYSSRALIVGLWSTVSNTRSWAIWGETGTPGSMSLDLSADGSATTAKIVSKGSVGNSAWQHHAFDFDGTNYRYYLDGVLTDTQGTPVTLYSPASRHLSIGGMNNGAFSASTGLQALDDLRITRGKALYAGSGFTPPASAYANPTSLSAGDHVRATRLKAKVLRSIS